MRLDRQGRIFRVGRLLWSKRSPGFACKLTVALVPRVFHWSRDVTPVPQHVPPYGFSEWRLTVLGLRLHYERDARGVLV